MSEGISYSTGVFAVVSNSDEGRGGGGITGIWYVHGQGGAQQITFYAENMSSTKEKNGEEEMNSLFVVVGVGGG